MSPQATRDWRKRNRDDINAARRIEYRAEHPLPEKRCVVCGGSFTKRPEAIVCGEECRRERNRARLERQRKAAARSGDLWLGSSSCNLREGH